jgi:hypothetical protein
MISNKEIPKAKELTNEERIMPKLNIRIESSSAFDLFISPEGKGLVGRSSLSSLISNRSFEIIPPRYKNKEEKINITRSRIL